MNASHLKFTNLRVISNKECVDRHVFTNQECVHNTTLCTFTNNGPGSSCGDSGSPLTIDSKLVAILSWGVPEKRQRPEQFTRISEFAQWIEEKTGIQAI